MYLSLSPTRAPSANASSSDQAFYIPVEVVKVIIREMRLDLNGLVRTNKRLQEWCQLLLTDAKPKLENLDRRISRLNWGRPASRMRLIKEIDENLDHIPQYHASQRLQRAVRIAFRSWHGNTPPPSTREKELNQSLQLAQRLPPKRAAPVLAAISSQPFRRDPTQVMSASLDEALALLASCDPALADMVDSIWTAQRAGPTAARLKKLVKETPLPSFLIEELISACPGSSWTPELKPYWFALILSTPDPAATCLQFVQSLVSGASSEYYSSAVRENPSVVREMCTSLVHCCKPQGERRVAEVLATLCGAVPKLHEPQQVHVLVDTLECARTMTAENRGLVATALIHILANDLRTQMESILATNSLTLIELGVLQRMLNTIGELGTQANPWESLFHAVCRVSFYGRAEGLEALLTWPWVPKDQLLDKLCAKVGDSGPDDKEFRYDLHKAISAYQRARVLKGLERWGDSGVFMELLLKKIPGRRNREAAKLFDLLLDPSQPDMPAGLLNTLVSQAHRARIPARSLLLEIILKQNRDMQAELMVTLARNGLMYLPAKAAEIEIKQIIFAAKPSGIPLETLLLDIVPSPDEGSAYPGLCANPTLLSDAGIGELVPQSRAKLLNRMVLSWHPQASALGDGLSLAADHYDLMRLLEKIGKLNTEAQANLLVALAGKLSGLKHLHHEAEQKLRSLAGKVSDDCLSQVDNVLKQTQ